MSDPILELHRFGRLVVEHPFRLVVMSRRIFLLVLPLLLVVASCASPSVGRPTDTKLRHGINLLLSEFEKRHPQMVSWKGNSVRNQLTKPLPMGRATEAGWTLDWSGATSQELSRVVVPWRLIGSAPKKYEIDSTNYSGGTLASENAVAQIKSAKESVDPWFAAIVHIRLSKTNPNWAIFTAVPFLPVTDIAYGWAQNQGGHWRVFDFGTALVGCGVTPASVLKEFGFSCPPV
jgi:hypothetical protein